MKRQAAPMNNYGVADAPSATGAPEIGTSTDAIAPGLKLPNAGHVWALDKVAGQFELVQMKYTIVEVNGHAASNTVKSSLAPFVYKPKVTWELPGVSATVRLHDGMPAIFFTSVSDSEDAADPTAKWGELTIVKLQVQGGKRLVRKTSYTQLTAKVTSSEDKIETVTEKFGIDGWYKMVPRNALPPGEYAFVRLPRQANLLGVNIFDFAIDPAAPQNPNAILADSTK